MCVLQLDVFTCRLKRNASQLLPSAFRSVLKSPESSSMPKHAAPHSDNSMIPFRRRRNERSYSFDRSAYGIILYAAHNSRSGRFPVEKKNADLAGTKLAPLRRRRLACAFLAFSAPGNPMGILQPETQVDVFPEIIQ